MSRRTESQAGGFGWWVLDGRRRATRPVVGPHARCARAMARRRSRAAGLLSRVHRGPASQHATNMLLLRSRAASPPVTAVVEALAVALAEPHGRRVALAIDAADRRDAVRALRRGRGSMACDVMRCDALWCAALCCAVLCCAVLCCAVLRCDELWCVVMRCDALCCAVLCAT